MDHALFSNAHDADKHVLARHVVARVCASEKNTTFGNDVLAQVARIREGGHSETSRYSKLRNLEKHDLFLTCCMF